LKIGNEAFRKSAKKRQKAPFAELAVLFLEPVNRRSTAESDGSNRSQGGRNAATFLLD
jgi:hypothetical protein